MRPALSLLRMTPAVGLTAGLAACADPLAAPATYVSARSTPSWSPPVQSYYRQVSPSYTPPVTYYYRPPRDTLPVEEPRPQPAPRMAEPQPAPAPRSSSLWSWLAPPAEAAPAPRPAQPDPYVLGCRPVMNVGIGVYAISRGGAMRIKPLAPPAAPPSRDLIERARSILAPDWCGGIIAGEGRASSNHVHAHGTNLAEILPRRSRPTCAC